MRQPDTIVDQEQPALPWLAAHGLTLAPDDEPARWTARLRTGLAILASETADDPRAGILTLWAVFPDGPGSAGLSEQDLWARLTLRAGDAAEAARLARARQAQRESPIPRLLLVEALLALGERENAEVMAASIAAVAAAGSTAPAQARAALAMDAGDREGAALAYAEAMAVRPDPIAMRAWAACLAAGGEEARALDVLQDALQVAAVEARPGLWHDVHAIHTARGHYQAAEAARHERDGALAALAERLREELEGARQAPRPRRSTAEAALPRPRATPTSGLLEHAGHELEDVAPEELRRALFTHFGHDEFRPGQAAVLRSLLSEGKDTLAIMPTGAGKSLTFQLPALLLPGVVLVVSPLVALMADQIAGLAEVPGLAGRATFINSTLGTDEVESRLARLAAGAYSLVYLAPERLRQATVQRILRQAGVSLLVIDEAHCLCLWGHDFRTEYLAVGALARALNAPRILAVTATATPAMQEEIAASLGRPLRVVSTGVLRENLYLEACKLQNQAEKRDLLIAFARRTPGAGIVYAGSRESCERLSRALRSAGIQAGYYHAGLTPAERAQTQDTFMSGRLRVLVATVAFGMGVHKRDVRFIVHFNPARSLEAYTQEAGRAGRDGRPAHCLLLWTSADKGTLTSHAREDHLTREALRALYARVRSAVRAAQGGPVEPSQLALASDDPAHETAARVGLSVLERAGFLRRGPDIPRDIEVLLTGVPDDERLARMASRLRIEPGRVVSRGATALAEALETPLEAVEDALAAWQQAGALDYRCGRRGMLLQLVEPPPADGAARLEALLDAYEDAALARARAMAAYMESNRCRNAVIARHFGEPVVAACGRCDNCAPERRAATSMMPKRAPAPRASRMEPQEAILALVRELPFSAGRSGLARILRGAPGSAIGPDRCRQHGALAGMSEARIVEAIDALIAAGLLELVQRESYRAVTLSEAGRAALNHEA